MEYDLVGMYGLPPVWKQPEWYDITSVRNSYLANRGTALLFDRFSKFFYIFGRIFNISPYLMFMYSFIWNIHILFHKLVEFSFRIQVALASNFSYLLETKGLLLVKAKINPVIWVGLL